LIFKFLSRFFLMGQRCHPAFRVKKIPRRGGADLKQSVGNEEGTVGSQCWILKDFRKRRISEGWATGVPSFPIQAYRDRFEK
jgi:hypothetical protein